MKICHIVPTSYLPVLNSVRSITKYLALAPLVLSSKEYCRFYSYLSRCYYTEIILDNGVFEDPKSPLTLTELALAAYKLYFSKTSPLTIVLPDAYLDGQKTKSLIRENAEKLYDLLYNNFSFSTPDFMGVVQGKTKEEMLDCFNTIVANPLITQIGIPHEAAYRAFTADYNIPVYRTREWAIEYLVTKSGVSDKVFHCLGLMGHPVEVFYLARLNHTLPNGCKIISLDTSAAFIHAWNNVKLSKLPKDCGKAKRPENFFDLPFKQDVADLFSEHVHWMNQAVIDGDLVITDPLDLEEKRESI